MSNSGNLPTLILRLNQETCAPRTRRHLTFRLVGHRVPDLCLTIRGSLHQVSYSYHDPHRIPPCSTCYLYTTRQANSILHTKQDKGEHNQHVPDSNSNLGMLRTHHNQIKVLITWFLNLPLDESIDNKKYKV
jgi:hypothetical protein